MITRITKVRKRDGRLVDFDERKIADAVHKAACAVGNDDRFLAEELAGVVTLFLEKRFSGAVPGIEEIQDMVEQVLIETGHARMAKAYILYRERRARAREQVTVHGESGAGPLVGNPAKAMVSSWSKSRIADALVREADLDSELASRVAARVEEKVFTSGVTRINTSAIRSLVEAELFLMGFSDRVGRQALVGLPRYDVDRLLRGGKEGAWRAVGPGDLKRTVAESLLAQYALSEVYSEEVVDAHLDARIHVTDVGSPFEWVGAVAHLPPAEDADAWVETAALLVGQLATLLTRELTLTGLAHDGLGWVEESGPGCAVRAARRLLGHTALRTLDRRRGRFRLALSLPALPEGEAARSVSEGLIREHWALFRAGHLDTLPEIVLHIPQERVSTDEGRRALLPALAAAAETGRVRIVFDPADEAPMLVTPWYRVVAGAHDGRGALPVGGAVALNVGTLGMEHAGDESALRDALDGAILLGIKALRQKRAFLGALQADPSAPLYRVAAGARPLVAGGSGIDLVELVGLRSAARHIAASGEDPVRVAGRLRAYAAVRIGEEGRRMRIKACLGSERDGEAARRFEAADRDRFGEIGPDGCYRDLEPHGPPEGVDFPQVESLLEPVSEIAQWDFAREQAPAPEALYAAACRIARDPRVRVLRLAPWPDRSVRATAANLLET